MNFRFCAFPSGFPTHDSRKTKVTPSLGIDWKYYNPRTALTIARLLDVPLHAGLDRVEGVGKVAAEEAAGDGA